MSKYITAEQINNAVALCKDEPFSKASVFAITEMLPSADVRENTHGEWIKICEDDEYSPFQCSVCLMDFDYIDGIGYLTDDELPNFCPNCGADMRGGADDT